MKRSLPLLLSALLLAGSVLPACGGAKENSTPAQASDVSATTQAATTADPYLPDAEKDYAGKQFTVLSTSDLKYICAEEENGNGINDAMVARERATEEKLNVTISYKLFPTISEVEPALKEAVMAGDDTYQLVVNHVNSNLTGYITENIAADWNTVPHIDFSMPYWNKDVISSLSVNGKSPIASGDITITDTVFMLFNKELAEDLSLGSLYDLVTDGTWTWDKLSKISSDVKADLNGDGTMDMEDRYGVVVNVTGSSWMLRDVPSSCGQFIYTNTPKGLTLTVQNEKTQTVLEKMCALFNGGGGLVLKVGTSQVTDGAAKFNEGHYLTYFVASRDAAYSFSDLSFDYGILPLPKWDDKQENYYALSWNPNIILSKIADADYCGLVTEWLAYYSYTYFRPAFYDSLMSSRFAQDARSVEMLDIINTNLVYDPGMQFSSPGFYSYFDGLVMQNNTNFTSRYNTYLESETAYLKTLNEAFANFGK